MLTPFAKMILFGLFIAALVTLLVLRLVKWFRNKPATQTTPLPRYEASSLASGLQPQDNRRSMQSQKASEAAVDKVATGVSDTVRQLESDVPMAKPLDSSSILVGGRSDSKTTLASTSAARESFLRDVPNLPPVDPGDIPIHGTADYRYGETATKSLAAMLPESATKRQLLKRELVNAGEYTPHAYDNFRAVRAVGVFGSILACLLALVLVPPQFEWLAILGLVVLPITFWALPTVLMRGKAAERRREIENGMPDMLDLLSMCVSQGMTVPNSLNRVARELKPVYPALSQELTITGEHARVGSLETAMNGLGHRVDIPEMHSFTSLMSQTERMGTSVSESLEVYSDNIRESLRQRADQKANTASFKLLFPTVLFLMPAVFLFLLGPALVDISDFFSSDASEILGGNARAPFANIRVEE